MIYLESTVTDPYFNLAMEEYVFEHMDRGQSYFMLWQNENTIVVGKYQNTAEEIHQQFVDEHGVRVVRRLSGGGAVYHDAGNLNYTFIVDQADLPDFDFKTFALPVVKTLARFGITAEFTGRNDLTIQGKKFCGNSQYAKQGRLLHHGCIMLDSNVTQVEAALQVKAAKFTSKSTKSVRSRITTINANAVAPISMEDFKKELKKQIQIAHGLTPLTLTPAQLNGIQTLKKEKYSNWEWNYGRSPAYEMRKEEKFPAGFVTVMLRSERGCIRDVRFYGDFFGNGEISSLEQALIGIPLNPELKTVLSSLNVGYYMAGIDADQLYRLLMC